MSYNHIHIISFDIPFPANYGGVIDVFYKIKYLHEKGIKITLHCFQYGKEESEELEKWCEKVYYYKRNTGIIANFSTLPYIVNSRKNDSLINNLLKDNNPILFEGKHSCYYLNDERLKNRLKIYRACNIEYDYYMGLCKAEKNILKKTFFYIEAIRLKKFQQQLVYADVMLPISKNDTAYLQKTFPNKKIIYIPAFHPNNDFDIQISNSNYILYHGKLSVPENEQAAIFLIKEVFAKEPDLKFSIAGLSPSYSLKKLCNKYNNVTLIESPSEKDLQHLIQHATINLLYTSQATGLKLKLLNVLYNGKHCVVNSKMIEGTSLESICCIANTPQEITAICLKLLKNPFDEKNRQDRMEKMSNHFSNKKSIKKLLEILEK